MVLFTKTLLINFETYKDRSFIFMGKFSSSALPICLNITIGTRHTQCIYSEKAKPAEKLDVSVTYKRKPRLMGEDIGLRHPVHVTFS